MSETAQVRKPQKSPPMKAADAPALPPSAEPEWFPIHELTPTIDMEIFVRASKKGRQVRVRFRKTRAYNPASMRYEPFLKMYDSDNNAKLTFSPIEWRPVDSVVPDDAGV